MGNTVSKAVDFGLKSVCSATGGHIGLSDQGLHLGPLRIKQDSLGLELSVGICSVNVKIEQNIYGDFSLEGALAFRIGKFASLTGTLGVDRNGVYRGVSGALNVGPIKANGNVSVYSDGKVRSLGTGATGTLLTNVNYSKKSGLSGGAFGLSVDEEENISCDVLKSALIEKAGEKVEKMNKIYKKEKKKKQEADRKESADRTDQASSERKETKNSTRGYCDQCKGPCKLNKR